MLDRMTAEQAQTRASWSNKGQAEEARASGSNRGWPEEAIFTLDSRCTKGEIMVTSI
jgi:hypothetical protein